MIRRKYSIIKINKQIKAMCSPPFPVGYVLFPIAKT